MKKIVALLLFMVMLTGLIAGCTPATTTAPTNATTATAKETQLYDGKAITISLLGHTSEATDVAMTALIKDFEADPRYSNITVNAEFMANDQIFQALQTRLMAKNVDIFEFGCFAIEPMPWDIIPDATPSTSIQYLDGGYILDLTNEAWINLWPKTAQVDGMTYKDKLYCVPTGMTAMNGIFYNKQIFADNGLTVPKTFDEFIALCEALKAKGIAPMTAGGKDQWPISMTFDADLGSLMNDQKAFDQGLWEGTRHYNDPDIIAIYNKYAQYCSYFEDGVMSIDYASVIGRFVGGKAAMMPDGTWQGSNIELADPNFDYGFFTMPSAIGNAYPQPLSGKYDIFYAGAANSEYPDAVKAFLGFYSQPENYEKFANTVGFIPVRTDINVTNKFNKEAAAYIPGFTISFEIYHAIPQGVGKYAGWKLLELKAMGGEIATVDELANLAQQDWADALAKLK